MDRKSRWPPGCSDWAYWPRARWKAHPYFEEWLATPVCDPEVHPATADAVRRLHAPVPPVRVAVPVQAPVAVPARRVAAAVPVRAAEAARVHDAQRPGRTRL